METIAGNHRQPRILGEPRIRHGKLAKIEDGAAIGFETAGVKTVGAEPGGCALRLLVP